MEQPVEVDFQDIKIVREIKDAFTVFSVSFRDKVPTFPKDVLELQQDYLKVIKPFTIKNEGKSINFEVGDLVQLVDETPEKLTEVPQI